LVLAVAVLVCWAKVQMALRVFGAAKPPVVAEAVLVEPTVLLLIPMCKLLALAESTVAVVVVALVLMVVEAQ
jgi:hypothetical protein